jgi:hypothetical protein
MRKIKNKFVRAIIGCHGNSLEIPALLVGEPRGVETLDPPAHLRIMKFFWFYMEFITWSWSPPLDDYSSCARIPIARKGLHLND